MASFAAANEWQGWWSVPQLRFELNQACEKLRLVTGHLHRERNYSAYLQGELERFQAHHHKSLKDLLEWQKERDWQVTCALRKKEEELSSLQRRCARKHEAENPTCNGVSLDEFKTQMVRKYMDENQQLSLKVEQLEMKLTENKGEDFCIGKLVEEAASPKAPKESSERRRGRPSIDSTVSTQYPGEEDGEVEDLEENKFPDEEDREVEDLEENKFPDEEDGEVEDLEENKFPDEEDGEVEDLEENKFPDEESPKEYEQGEKEDLEKEEKLEAPSQELPAGQDQTMFLPEEGAASTCNGESLDETSTHCVPGTQEPCCWGSLFPPLRVEISSYLAVPALCAARATSREGSSTEAFVASVVQLLEPRLSVFVASAEIYTFPSIAMYRDKLVEHEQALAEKHFQLFAGVQGFKYLFFIGEAVNRWWGASQLALTGIVKTLVQHSSENMVRRLLLILVSFNVRHLKDKGCQRYLGEQLLAVLGYCSKGELRQACCSFRELARDCQDPDFAEQCIKALAEIWLKHRQDPPELKGPAIQALAAWMTTFPEHYERIRDLGVAL